MVFRICLGVAERERRVGEGGGVQLIEGVANPGTVCVPILSYFAVEELSLLSRGIIGYQQNVSKVQQNFPPLHTVENPPAVSKVPLHVVRSDSSPLRMASLE